MLIAFVVVLAVAAAAVPLGAAMWQRRHPNRRPAVQYTGDPSIEASARRLSEFPWLFARPGRTLAIAGPFAVGAIFGAWLTLAGRATFGARILMGLMTLGMLITALFAVLTESVFVRSGRVRAGRGGRWWVLKNEGEISVVERSPNVVCLMISGDGERHVLLTATSAWGLSQRGLVRAVTDLRRRVLAVAGIGESSGGHP